MDAIPSPAAENQAPRHVSIAGGLGLVWNGLGCVDYVLTNLRFPAYVAQLPPDVIDSIDALPAWAIVAWAASVGCGVIGCLLLLDRSRRAVLAFAISLATLAAAQRYREGEDRAGWTMRRAAA